MSEVHDDLGPPFKRARVGEPVVKDDGPSFADDVTDTNDKEFVVDSNKYMDFVTPEEMQRLHEFKVLDEVKSNDEDSNEGDSDSSDEKSEGVPEEEIEKMLDEDLPEDFKGAPKPKEKPYITRQKTVLEEKGINHFEVLPLDWMMVRHHSGMPVYIHRTSRVCTLSKPYFLGKGNTRRHDIPISAIPCLAYRKALAEEEKEEAIDRRIEAQIRDGTWALNRFDKATVTEHKKESTSQESKDDIKEQDIENSQVENDDIEVKINVNNEETAEVETKCPLTNGELNLTESSEPSCPIKHEDSSQEKPEDPEEIPLHRRPVLLPGGAVMPPPRVETVASSWKTQHLTHEQVNDYCKKLFKFKTVNIMHFKRWADRRKYTKARKTLQYPTLPAGTRLITIPAANDPTGVKGRRDCVMNMNGRSYLSVFHEYVCRALQEQPVYEFTQLENAATPYQATVYIGGMAYGAGRGTSKRQAKAAAARASIAVLIPELADQPASDHATDFTFFDYVSIEDPRIEGFCAATCEPSPHAILRTCLLRNFGAGDTHIHTEMKKLEYQKIEMTMRVGKHSATVVSKNKKTAKQRASQAILQALHPHVRSWGSLLRLYGSRSVKSCKEKKLEEQQITLLQDKARHNEPNYAVLEKLRQEMNKLKERDAAVVPIGTLLLSDSTLPQNSGSNLNNVDI